MNVNFNFVFLRGDSIVKGEDMAPPASMSILPIWTIMSIRTAFAGGPERAATGSMRTAAGAGAV